MTKKAILNIVYSPQQDPPHKVYENEKGEVWNSSTRQEGKINIGMGWYSIRKPKKDDSIFVVEPYCVLDRDYDPSFTIKFNKIFTWATKAFESPPKINQKVVKVNHPCFHSYPTGDQAAQSWVPWDQKENKIVFVCNNKTSQHHSELYSLRVQLADMLHDMGDFEVCWYGQIPLKRSFYKGKLEDKRATIAKAKFSVCTENCYDHVYSHGYFSEKMPDVWAAGTMPLYMGCHNIDEFGFFDGSYIDLRKYVEKHGKRFRVNDVTLKNHLKSIDATQHKEWSDRVKTEIIDSDKFREQIMFKNTYETMIDAFYEELNKE